MSATQNCTPEKRQNHQHFMHHALSLAHRALGRTAPNPAVGCVIVKNSQVIGAGSTSDGGRPHAEPNALQNTRDNGYDATGATAYVTLEPCAHYGQTPPCAETLIKAGIARCVIGCTDPDPRVSGKGIAILQNAGVEIITGVLEQECINSNAGFFLTLNKNRPFITIKLAISADGKIAGDAGQRTQITGEIAGLYTHHLRSKHDAILVGKTTFEIDKPKLTTRLPGYTHDLKHYILSAENFDDPHNIKSVLAQIASDGITRLMVEGGAKTIQSFLQSGYYDEFHLLKAPHCTIGTQGVDALPNYDISNIADDFSLNVQKTRTLGEDLLEIYTPKA